MIKRAYTLHFEHIGALKSVQTAGPGQLAQGQRAGHLSDIRSENQLFSGLISISPMIS